MMKKTIKKGFIAAIALVLLLASCSKDDNSPEPEQKIVLSSAKQLTAFTFSAAGNTSFAQDVTATINEEAKTITTTLPSDADLSALTPTLVISTKASISPTGLQDFTNPVTYTVTAEDGTKATYTAAFNSNSSAKQLTSFMFLLTNNAIDDNVVGVIDEEAKTITATMPSGTNITGLLPEILISENATVNPNTAQDFTSPIEYTVIAEDGSEIIYTVTVTKLLTQKEVLQAILDANPNNTLGWDLTNTTDIDLGTLNGIVTDVEGNIVEIDMFDQKLIALPSEIEQLANLIELDIEENSLIIVPAEIGNLLNLLKLRLSDNSLTSIPPEIGNLVNLIELRLFNNSLTAVPPEIGNLVNLRELSIDGNSLTTVPPEIGNLVNLERLYLYSNGLTTIPSEIGDLLNLKQFNFSNNNLTTVPIEIGNLINLESLDFGRNSLTTLPLEIGNLVNLEYLSLKRNNLTTVPNEIGNLINLEILVFSENKLTTLPSEIGFLTNLETLFINDNNLTGLPRAVCNLESYNNVEIVKSTLFVCETVSPKDALISIYSANPDNTLDWGVTNFSGVTFDSQQSIVEIDLKDKGIERITSGVATLESLELLDVRDNPLASIHNDVCALTLNANLTLLADTSEGCN